MPKHRKLFERATELRTLTPAERRFLVKAWIAAPFVEAVLGAVGLERVLATLERRRFAPRGERIDVERGERLVRAAFRYGPAKSGCLPESIVQYALHLRTGPEPRLVIGVRKVQGDARDENEPKTELGAHAWIEELAGARRLPEFAPILTLSPRGRSGHVEAAP